MAEVVGLVSAVLALGGAAAKMSMTLYTIAEQIGSAGLEARMVADEVSFFSQALTAMSKSLDRKTSQSARLHSTAQELIAACQVVLAELSSLAEQLRGSATSSRRRAKMSSMVGRVKWLLQKPKVAFLRSSINSFKTTLTLLVATMDYTEAVDRRAPDNVREPMRAQVESLVETSKSANHLLVNSQKLLEAYPPKPRNPETLLIDLAVDERQPSEDVGQDFLASPSNRVEELSDTASENDDLKISLKPNINAQRLVFSLAHDALYRPDSQRHWTWDDSETDAEDANTANSHSKHVYSATSLRPEFVLPKSSRKWSTRSGESPLMYQTGVGAPPEPSKGRTAYRHASDSTYGSARSGNHDPWETASNETQSAAIPNATPQKPSARLPRREPRDRMSELERKLDELLMSKQGGSTESVGPRDNYEQRTEDKYMPASRPFMTGHHSAGPSYGFGGGVLTAEILERAVETSVARLMEAADKQKNNSRETDDLRALITKYEEQTRAAEDAARVKASDEVARRKQKSLQSKIRELQAELDKTKPADDFMKAPLRFKDAVGRKFSLPWHIVKTWKGMETIIKQAFLHVDVIGEHVHAGHYDLTGPDGEIILPQVWADMVQPDWEITMHMWPLPEPPQSDRHEDTTETHDFKDMSADPQGLGSPQTKKGRKPASSSVYLDVSMLPPPPLDSDLLSDMFDIHTSTSERTARIRKPQKKPKRSMNKPALTDWIAGHKPKSTRREVKNGRQRTNAKSTQKSLEGYPEPKTKTGTTKPGDLPARGTEDDTGSESGWATDRAVVEQASSHWSERIRDAVASGGLLEKDLGPTVEDYDEQAGADGA